MTSLRFDERKSAGAEHLDAEYVAAYEAKTGADPADELAFLRGHGLRAETTLVDFGAGTGLLAIAAAPHCRRVVAVDPSTAMLAYAKGQADELGIANVDFVEAGFLSYEHEGDRPSLVHTRNALHHVPDFWKVAALQRVHDLLVPGGTFILRDLAFSFEPAELERALDSFLAGGASSSARGWTRKELAKDVRDEFITFSWLLEPMLTHVGFEISEAMHRREAYVTYICTRP